MNSDAKDSGRRTRVRHQGQPTINDVARLANCSPMTVSRVINNKESVREETRRQVLAAIAELNYTPNRAARSLAGGEQLRVALLFDNPSASYLREFQLGALAEATRGDVHLVVQSCPPLADAPPLMRTIAEGGFKGFLLPPPLCVDQISHHLGAT